MEAIEIMQMEVDAKLDQIKNLKKKITDLRKDIKSDKKVIKRLEKITPIKKIMQSGQSSEDEKEV